MLASLISLAVSVMLAGSVSAAPARTDAAAPDSHDAVRPRVFVLTDIGLDPDDSESLVRFLLYSNQFDVEGLAAVTSTWLRDKVHPELIEERVKAYGEVRPNLVKHAPGYPTEPYLQDRVASGLPLYGLEGVGQGKDSAASDLLIAAVDRADSRPVWVVDWGGANVLAQALWKVRESRPPQQVDAFVARLRAQRLQDYPATDPRYPERGLQASGEVTYSEGIDVGYRWFERQGITPLYPFGYGLAYTRFEYSRLSVGRAGDGGLDVKFEVRNIGHAESDEVPQVYLGAPTTPPRDARFAVRALAGFDRIHLRPGEQRTVLIHVRPRSLQYWNEQSGSWKRPDGTRDLFVGPSSADLPLRQRVRLSLPSPGDARGE